MHTIVITFSLTPDMSDARYREVCADMAPAFAGFPGLLAKVWLADPDANRYGGIYLFADDAAADMYLDSALFRTVRTFPQFTDLTMLRMPVDETATRRTQPGLAVVGATAGSPA